MLNIVILPFEYGSIWAIHVALQHSGDLGEIVFLLQYYLCVLIHTRGRKGIFEKVDEVNL